MPAAAVPPRRENKVRRTRRREVPAIDLDAALAAALASMAVASGQELRTLILAAWVAVLSAADRRTRGADRRQDGWAPARGAARPARPVGEGRPVAVPRRKRRQLGQFLGPCGTGLAGSGGPSGRVRPAVVAASVAGAAGSPAPSIGFSYWTLPSRSPAAVVVERIDSGLHGCGVRLVCLEQSGRPTARVDYDPPALHRRQGQPYWPLRYKPGCAPWCRHRLDRNLPWPDAVAYGDAIGSGSSATTGCILDAFRASGAPARRSHRRERRRPAASPIASAAPRIVAGERAAGGRASARRTGSPSSCAARPELVTALLATLYAGGAFVPLDPANPARRTGG